MSDYGYCPTCSQPGVKRFALLGLTRCLNGHRHSSHDFNPPAPKRTRENSIEQYLIQRVRETGGETRKIKWIGHDGAPDRLVGWPSRKLNFGTFEGQPVMPDAMTKACHALVELKRPKGVAEIHQRREHDKLRAMGFIVAILDTKAAIDEWVAEMTS